MFEIGRISGRRSLHDEYGGPWSDCSYSGDIYGLGAAATRVARVWTYGGVSCPARPSDSRSKRLRGWPGGGSPPGPFKATV
jgi:hypothetical protein